MRASRATELADLHAPHVAASWLGHSEKIADAPYRQVTASHLGAALAEQGFALPEPGIVERLFDREQSREVLERVLSESSKCLIIIPSSFQATAKELFSPENDTDTSRVHAPKYSRRAVNFVKILGESSDRAENCAVSCAPVMVSVTDDLARFLMGWDKLTEPIQQAVRALVATAEPARPAPILVRQSIFERHLTL